MKAQTHQRGFTLVEVMVVIVVMGIMASLVLINLNSTDHRKALQARELFLLDLEKINREANDQSRVLALQIQPATDVSPFRYQLQEYLPANNGILTNKTWQAYPEFKIRSLPAQVAFDIQALDYPFQNAKNNQLLAANAPQLIWLGNGEVKPVRIQFYLYGNAIGDAIEIDYLGQLHAK